MTLLDRVRELCKEKNISQRKLEKDISISNGASSKWAKSTPSGEVLQKLSNYFGVTVDYLITGKEPEPNVKVVDEHDNVIVLDDEVCIRLIDLPCRINGITVQDENGFYNVYINARLSTDEQKKAIAHELTHVKRDDFYSLEPINMIEHF